jgi:large repetitive protein
MKSTILLTMLCSFGVHAAEYIVVVNPLAKNKLNLQAKTYKGFTVKETFQAFDRDLAVVDIADEKNFKQTFFPNYFAYLEKNQTYKLMAGAKRPPVIDVTDWDPKPVITNDPDYYKLWAILNFGQKLQQTGVKKMDSSIGQAWGFTQNAKKVLVGVMDTGIDYRHKDIAANVWVGPDKNHGYNAVNPGLDTYDDNILSHGSHVSGTIAAIPNNKTGIAGIAWNAKIVPVKIFKKDSTTTTAVILRGLDWFAQHPEIRVINHSWGGGEYSKLMDEAFKKLDSAGVVNVLAAGNSNSNIDLYYDYPGSFNLPNAIIVAAHDSKGVKPTFTNYGPNRVDIAAPGVDIYSLATGNSYQSLTGTFS